MIEPSDTTTVDLFAGPGGWDLAARALGLDPLGIEWDDAACATRQAAGLRTLQADVAELDPADLIPCTGLIASPPCPTFSAAGNGAARHLTDALVACMRALADGEDTRDETRAEAERTLLPHAKDAERAKRDAGMSVLVVEPLRWALALRPEWIALEQVPAVLPLWRVVASLLEPLGYSTWCGILEAERFGVPQTRERAVLMARRGGAVHPPEPTHHRYVPNEPRPEHTEGLFGSLEPWVSMAEALGWGMTERPGMTFAPGTAQGGPDAVGGSGARATLHGERDRGAWRDSPVTGLDRRQGGAPVRQIDEPAHTMSSSGLATGRDVWRTDGRTAGEDWPEHRPATTIAGDPRAFQSGGHHVEGQQAANAIRLTVEEAAVLQSFPPDYPWQGSRSKRYQQIGNAVPPRLALHVLAALLGVAVPDPVVGQLSPNV